MGGYDFLSEYETPTCCLGEIRIDKDSLLCTPLYLVIRHLMCVCNFFIVGLVIFTLCCRNNNSSRFSIVARLSCDSILIRKLSVKEGAENPALLLDNILTTVILVKLKERGKNPALLLDNTLKTTVHLKQTQKYKLDKVSQCCVT